MSPSEFGDPYRPCPCGSGKKYKFCCLANDREAGRSRDVGSERRPFAGFGESRYTGPGDDVLVMDFAEGNDAVRRGLALLEAGRTREARGCFEKALRAMPLVPLVHNNLALVHYVEGDIDGAIHITRHVLRDLEPDNVFALGNLVQFLLLAGKDAEAAEAGRRLRSLAPRDPSAAYKLCEALARLGDHEGVLAAATAALRDPRDLRGEFEYFAGVAAANLGRIEEAERFLHSASPAVAHAEMLRRYRKLIKSREAPPSLDGGWPYLHPSDWLHPELLRAIPTTPRIQRLPGTARALLSFLEEDPSRDELITLLRESGTAAAIDVLRRIAFGTFGSRDLRAKALAALGELGVAPADASHRTFDGERWTELATFKVELDGTAATPLPERHRDAMAEGLRELHSNRPAAAETIFRRILADAPEAEALGAFTNLAAALHALDRDDEAEKLLVRAIALDPSYIAARAALCELRLQADRAAEARDAMAGLVMPKVVHPDIYARYLLASARLALVEQSAEDTLRLAKMAAEIAIDERLVKEAKGLTDRKTLQMLVGLEHLVTDLVERRRRRLLDEDAPLAELIGGNRDVPPKTVAAALGFRLGFREKARSRMGAVLSDALLRDHSIRDRAVRSLEPEGRSALESLVNAGGGLPFAEFTSRHCGTPKSPRVFGRTRRSLLEELEIRGFAYAATTREGERVFIPRELRGPLAESLARVGAESAAAPDR